MPPIAELELGRGTVRLSAWIAQEGRMCMWAAVVTPAEPQGYGGPLGHCVAAEPCGRLCVVQQQLDEGATPVVGAVAAEADTLRLIRRDAPPIRLDLDGPPLAGFPGWRVVVAHLGRRSYGHAELRRRGERIARLEDVEYDYPTEDCLERAGRRTPQ